MVQEQIIARGIRNTFVIEAMKKVPRHEFIPAQNYSFAYEDKPVAIGSGQTISQPYIIALMLDLLELDNMKTVLEIGTGSGYQTALLAEICTRVFTVETIEDLARHAHSTLQRMHYRNIHYYLGDGSMGFHKNLKRLSVEDPDPVMGASYQKFDGIVVSAACPNRLEILFHQLMENGKMVAPVGDQLDRKSVV